MSSFSSVFSGHWRSNGCPNILSALFNICSMRLAAGNLWCFLGIMAAESYLAPPRAAAEHNLLYYRLPRGWSSWRDAVTPGINKESLSMRMTLPFWMRQLNLPLKNWLHPATGPREKREWRLLSGRALHSTYKSDKIFRWRKRRMLTRWTLNTWVFLVGEPSRTEWSHENYTISFSKPSTFIFICPAVRAQTAKETLC